MKMVPSFRVEERASSILSPHPLRFAVSPSSTPLRFGGYNAWCEMNRSPVNQVGEGQERSPQLSVKPEAEVMQGDTGGQARPKALEMMRAFAFQAKRNQQLSMDGFHDLPEAGQPAPPGFRPGVSGAGLLGRDRKSTRLNSSHCYISYS